MARRKPKTRGYGKRHIAMAALGFPTAGLFHRAAGQIAAFYKKPTNVKGIQGLEYAMKGKMTPTATLMKRVRRRIRGLRYVSLGAAGIGAYGLGRIIASKFHRKKKIRRK